MTVRWWHYGLLGGGVLMVATSVKIVEALVVGHLDAARWAEAARLLPLTFGMGFVCGLVAWAGRGLSRRFGLWGDALVGMAIGLVFFTACMRVFDPELLGPKLRAGGLPMLGMGAALGLLGGFLTGRDLRR
jgi:hypothetical protein